MTNYDGDTRSCWEIELRVISGLFSCNVEGATLPLALLAGTDCFQRFWQADQNITRHSAAIQNVKNFQYFPVINQLEYQYEWKVFKYLISE